MKVALIGLGYMGKKYVPELMDLDAEGALEFVGVSDIDTKRLHLNQTPRESFRFEEQHNELRKYADAAIIATPNSTHFNVALDWVNSGKHVLVEKPVCVGQTEILGSTFAQHLLEIAKEKNAFIMPGHLFRFSRLVQEIRKVIDSGDLGRISQINLRWITPVPASGTDRYMDLMPHCLDILDHIFGLDGLTFAGQHNRGTSRVIFMEYAWHDKIATIEIGWGLPEKHRSIEIMGERKWLSTDLVKSFQFLYLTNPKTGEREERWVAPNNTLQDEIRGFLRMASQPKKDYSLMEAAIQGLRLIEETVS